MDRGIPKNCPNCNETWHSKSNIATSVESYIHCLADALNQLNATLETPAQGFALTLEITVP